MTKTVYEHLIIYTDRERGTQTWQWVKREPGQPQAQREYTFGKNQSGEALLQRLPVLVFTPEEEENLTLSVMTVKQRARQAFDVEKVTKRFYDLFKKQHADFLNDISGIPDLADREWYASLMLNRLMFVYFVQRKGFLDGDRDYLRTRMTRVQREHGQDRFYSFYRTFLLRLFHDGLGRKQAERAGDLQALLGNVPYLNGGLFELHALERANTEIVIPDAAFSRIFDFFDAYQWHLDERPLRDDNEINPDVLGYIFEKYINQKQMGAYYTKEDITEYISKNTIIPFLFDRAAQDVEIAFRPGSAMWRLLSDDPDRYIYAAVKKGAELELPAHIAAGVNDVRKRGEWNKAAPAEFALPTEIWREVVARRQRYSEVRAKLAGNEIHSINDLITLNLNIRQFAQDVIENCEGPDLLRALYDAIAGVTVLDPTCGSGAFLFAALTILEPLYEACLERMQGFVDDADLLGKTRRGVDYGDFRATLARMAKHPNRRYFVLKSIIINNLFGVDIMEEATEIAKLRLFLKLAAQVQPNPTQPNLGLEALPDIDFNIRAGNSLVGFANAGEVQAAITRKFDWDDAWGTISRKAAVTAALFANFRSGQVSEAAPVREMKAALSGALDELRAALDNYLAAEYGIAAADKQADYADRFAAWQESHRPFHWWVEFYPIIERGGFDVIIGNPPYVEYSKVRSIYQLQEQYSPYATNLYSACCFRATTIKAKGGYASFIVPVSLPSTDRMQQLRNLLNTEHNVHSVSFSTRPAKLFEGAEQRLTIYIQSPSNHPQLYSGGYLKWATFEREHLFPTIIFVGVNAMAERNEIWPKIRSQIENSVFAKMQDNKALTQTQMLGQGSPLFYKNTGIRYFSTVTLRPPHCWINGVAASSSRETVLNVKPGSRHSVHALLLSNSFFVYYQQTSNCRDLNPSDITLFPTPDLTSDISILEQLSLKVEEDYVAKGRIIKMKNKLTGLVELESLSPAKSKPIIDEIDRVLALHYGFTDEELDFIINYDIKYRMGKDADEGEE